MLPAEFYNQRLIALHKEVALLYKKKSLLAWLRFGTVMSIAPIWYFLISFGLWYVLVPCFLLVVLFTRLLFFDIKNKHLLEHHKYLIGINEDELKMLAHNYTHRPGGHEHIRKDHYYANDLDIFGHASLYQYINRTSSEMGADTLSGWLLQPSTPNNILHRQDAIKELASQPEWRQQLQAFGASKKIKFQTKSRLQNWFNEESRFINNKFWLILQYAMPAIILSVIALNISDLISNYTRNYFLLVSAFIAFYTSKKVTPLHEQVSKMTGELEVFSESIQLIEQSAFKSAYLLHLQSLLTQQKQNASSQLFQLKKILERLDLRFNFIVFIPLDILLQWDLQQVIALEKWKQLNQKNVMAWFTALGEFEAVSSLSTLAFNHPHWCFPTLQKAHFYIEGKEIGHPLITADSCVTNPLNINQAGELMLVTGSNMAGKSTYLRSIGINTVLAMAGSPVCAKQFSLSPVQVISSMRIADNLEESTSTFYAELKKLKTIIDKVNSNEQVFILLDEILRGTNSLDRHTGSAALIKQLIKYKAACIIATHDVELAKLKETYPENILNYHFDVQVSNEELYFDYRLKAGICTSLNASILMKKIGIEL